MKMAAFPINGKPFKNLLLQNQETLELNLGIKHKRLRFNKFVPMMTVS